MNDLISRQAAINTVNTMATRCTTNDMNDLHDMIVESLTLLPSAERERKTDLIDRQEVIKAFTEMDHMGLSERDIIHEFETMPSVDAVEVVWCKDCKHFIEHGFPWGMCEVRGCTALPDDYCSQAKRRTDNNGLD